MHTPQITEPSLETQALGNIRLSYNADRTDHTFLHGQTVTAPACVFWTVKGGTTPESATVEFFLDGKSFKVDTVTPYDLKPSGTATCSMMTFTPGEHTVRVNLNGAFNDDATFKVAAAPTTPTLPSAGTSSVNISNCARIPDSDQPSVVLPGNASNPAALAPDGSVYVTFLRKAPLSPVIVRYANGSCSTPKPITSKPTTVGDTSHDASSAYVDGQGHIITTYYGSIINEAWLKGGKKGPQPPAPYIRRTTSAGDLNTFGSENKARLLNYAEIQGFRMQDGKVFIAGADQNGRYDIMNTDGNWALSSARQVVQQDRSAAGAPNCTSGGEGFNRHTKTVFHQGKNGKLYAIWGYSLPYNESNRPATACKDLRHYTEDEHEVFFAYSTDGGNNWKNASGSRTVPVGTCTATDCTGGIKSADKDFKITTLRQREHRKLWVEADGRVNIAFSRSIWCTTGTCTKRETSSTFKPGALMYLSFYPGQTIGEPVTVNSSEHNNLPGIRVEGGKVYIWAHRLRSGGGEVVEYVSSDRKNFTATTIQSGCSRSHGDTAAPEFKSVLIVSSCNRDVQLYRRNF